MNFALSFPALAAGRRRTQAFIVTRLRNNDMALLLWSLLAGIAAGIAVTILRDGVMAMRSSLYEIPFSMRLSSAPGLKPWRMVLIPTFGGLLVGIVSRILRRLSAREPVDAIEANALYGGRMSLRDSLQIGLTTMLSGGVGASVGLEAGFTQMGGALGSQLGRALRLRRDDVRTLVACGAAGGIAAAFNAPLAGAFYAFELILGSYAPASLGAVAVAALSGMLTGRILIGTEPVFLTEMVAPLHTRDYFIFVLLGLGAAGLSIAVMRGVTVTERLFRRNEIPAWGRPAVGGFLLGILALVFPSILGSGHGAIVAQLHSDPLLLGVAGLLVAKAVGSAISIGSGFRGGLFSSSLFLGSLYGSMFAGILTLAGIPADPVGYALVGMGTVAAGIVGAPVAMIMLVLETTGDFTTSIGVMVGVITTSVAVRQWFGYSFATWRFHIRGLPIVSPEDVGWINELTVGRLMDLNPSSVAASTTIGELLKAYPAGSTRHVFAVDGEGALRGEVDIAEAAALDPVDAAVKKAGDMAHHAMLFLMPHESVRQALQRFRDAAVETLPVVNNGHERRIVGSLTEAFALRRYAQELERRKGLETDNAGIFSPAER